MKELLVQKDERPYGFPPALWVALGKGRTIVSEPECEDPTCRWMIMSCTDRQNLLVDNIVEDDGNISWGVNDVTDSYKLEAKKWKNTHLLNKEALKNEVVRRFERFEYYRRLEMRETDVSDEVKRKWMEEKRGHAAFKLNLKMWVMPHNRTVPVLVARGFDAVQNCEFTLAWNDKSEKPFFYNHDT